MNLRLSLVGSTALLKGDPWIAPQAQLSYRQVPAAGTILRVQNMNGDFLGWCVSEGPGVDPAFRILSRERHVDFGEPWFASAVEQSLAKRRAMALPEGPRRLIHGEADGLPGLACELSDGVALLHFASPGLAVFDGLIEAALIQQARLRGLWRRHLQHGVWGPWHRSPLLPKSPARFNAGEPGLKLGADLEAAPSGAGLPQPLDQRAWRAWARTQSGAQRVLVLGGLDGEAAAAESAGPAKCLHPAGSLFKAFEKAGSFRPQRVLAWVPAESKESFGKFDASKHLPRFLKDLAAMAEPGALLLLASPAKALWHAQPWEEAWAAAAPARAELLQVLGPEADYPDLATWPQGRAKKAFIFKLV